MGKKAIGRKKHSSQKKETARRHFSSSDEGSPVKSQEISPGKCTTTISGVVAEIMSQHGQPEHEQHESQEVVAVREEAQYLNKVGQKRKRTNVAETASQKTVQESQSTNVVVSTSEEETEDVGSSEEETDVLGTAMPTQWAVYDKKRKLQYISNLLATIRCVKKLKLRDQQVEVIKEYSPFWEVIMSIKNKTLTTERTQKNTDDIKQLILRFDKTTESFSFPEIHPSPIKLTVEDVVNTFGVTRGEEKIEQPLKSKLLKDMGPFLDCFRGIQKLSHGKVKKILLKISKEKTPQADVLTCQLLTLYILMSLFVPGVDDKIPWFFVNLLADPTTMKSYDWAEFIHRYLHSSLKRSPTPNTVCGCVMILPVIYLTLSFVILFVVWSV